MRSLFFVSEVWHLHSNGTGYAGYLYRIRPAWAGNDTEAGDGRLLLPQSVGLQNGRQDSLWLHTEPIKMDGINRS